MKNTKKAKKTKLSLERETLRALHVYELRVAEGGSRHVPENPGTGASGADVCCA